MCEPYVLVAFLVVYHLIYTNNIEYMLNTDMHISSGFWGHFIYNICALLWVSGFTVDFSCSWIRLTVTTRLQISYEVFQCDFVWWKCMSVKRVISEHRTCETPDMWNTGHVKHLTCETPDMWNTGHVKHLTCETPWHVKHPDMWNTWHVKHWTCETLDMWNTWHVKHLTCETLDMWNTGHVKHRTCETPDMWNTGHVWTQECAYYRGILLS